VLIEGGDMLKDLWNDRSDLPLRLGLIGAVVVGWFFEALFTFNSQNSQSEALRAFAVLWFASGAAFFLGTFLGFLFGIPKRRPGDPADPTKPIARLYEDNTNLDEISDWLTKIIVGLGLADFRDLVGALREVSSMVGASVNSGVLVPGTPDGGATAIAFASIVFGFVCGFLFYYLWARIWLFKLFNG
jgi:putative flippase GtrA